MPGYCRSDAGKQSDDAIVGALQVGSSTVARVRQPLKVIEVRNNLGPSEATQVSSHIPPMAVAMEDIPKYMRDLARMVCMMKHYADCQKALAFYARYEGDGRRASRRTSRRGAPDAERLEIHFTPKLAVG